jgi:hypothetical protein
MRKLVVCISVTTLIASVIAAYALHRPAREYLTIDDLCFDLTEGAETNVSISQSIALLDGRTVEIVGDVWAPTDENFDLTDYSQYNNGLMSHPPLAQQFLHVSGIRNPPMFIPPDRALVHGKLHVKVEKNESGQIISIYRLDADWVKRFPAESEQQ